MIEITKHKVKGAAACRVFAVDEPDHESGGGGRHRYVVVHDPAADGEYVDASGDWKAGHVIRFQHGPIGECGANGLTNEALLAIVLHRLECFQAGKFASDMNARAATAVGDGLQFLLTRTHDRIRRGVEGQNKV